MRFSENYAKYKKKFKADLDLKQIMLANRAENHSCMGTEEHLHGNCDANGDGDADMESYINNHTINNEVHHQHIDMKINNQESHDQNKMSMNGIMGRDLDISSSAKQMLINDQ